MRIGVDVGGTFTDLVLVGADGATRLVRKEDTTHGRYADAVKTGLTAIASEMRVELGELLAEVEVFVHGSTIATNMLIERTGPRLGLICSEGHRDVLYFRDGFKPARYDLRSRLPEPLVERRFRLGVDERIRHDGTVERPLDEDGVRRAATALREGSVEAVAVALLWSHVNPAHERRVRDLVSEVMPDVPVILSSDVVPSTGEWVRTSATALSAYVSSATGSYLRELESWLRRHGLRSRLQIMQVNGGSATVEQCLKVPVGLTHSGPAAAPVAAGRVSRRIGTAPSGVLSSDMGGTSFDVVLVQDDQIPLAQGIEVDFQPIGIPGVDLHSIGSGGGSIAWVDSGGALRVGPDSAGSIPGPAAYGNGGSKPTVTDANLVLGRLPGALSGGRRPLSRPLAAAAIEEQVARKLGISLLAAAAGIVNVVEEDMAGAMRAVSVERGIDPRSFLLVAGGGAGAMHAAELARKLGMGQVLVPREAGCLSAYGMTAGDVRHDYSFSHHSSTEDGGWSTVERLFADLERRAESDLVSSGLDPATARFERSVDARYRGQVHSITVPVAAEDEPTDAMTGLRKAFDAEHRRRFSYDLQDHPVEFLQWRLAAISASGLRPAVGSFGGDGRLLGTGYASGSRRAVFDPDQGEGDCRVFALGDLGAGDQVEGPAFVDSEIATVVLPPGDRLLADGQGSVLLRLRPESPNDISTTPLLKP